MDGSIRNSKLQTNNTRSSIPVHETYSVLVYKITRLFRENNRYKRNRYYKCLYAIIGFSLFLPQYANAEAVGGVSATADSVANSSGSVTNKSFRFFKVLISPILTGEGSSVREKLLTLPHMSLVLVHFQDLGNHIMMILFTI